MEIVASSHRARTTMCTPVGMATSTARTQAAIGNSMRTAVGQTLVLSRRLMLRIRRGPKGHKARSVLVRAQPTERARRSSQPSPQRPGNNSIETLAHAREERSERSSSSGNRAEGERGVPEGAAGDGLSEIRVLWDDLDGRKRATGPSGCSESARRAGLGDQANDDKFSIEGFWVHRFSLLRVKAELYGFSSIKSTLGDKG